ncbi:MAG: hypothetical protein P4L67_04465 [Candidatus Pacebacteria bacterium]|nr:hypothetical protein [Candidatus Paceibacterota bacterium]
MPNDTEIQGGTPTPTPAAEEINTEELHALHLSLMIMAEEVQVIKKMVNADRLDLAEKTLRGVIEVSRDSQHKMTNYCLMLRRKLGKTGKTRRGWKCENKTRSNTIPTMRAQNATQDIDSITALAGIAGWRRIQ